MINEALAEEEQRGEQRKKRSDKVTAAVPESEPAAPGAKDLREVLVEPYPNPNRLLMKSASSTACGSGQQREKRPVQILNRRCKLKTRRRCALSTTSPRAP